ncbi:hypothetical protein H5392_12380 [Tessaracoccus sp. MC1865]|uniref:hypothetical protein n=1 Tax=Tessaracoccus sp. MC1865 TaxID=2760310 RepID=UPI0015FFE9CA|nr:hypothetical protein [Tessaracoccus sp. MC1865]MBB1484651.1 hypothetical protein [Tessaracoccus sp. MC1865]QTO36400.1 hypothetical protein J7D54_07675 [Tessaracoccus sp. MC1865]
MADKAVKGFMEENNLTQEPMIHSKAITGGGAYYKKGKEPKPFNYLTEDQFMQLDMDLRSLVAECKGDDGNGEEEAS